MSDNQADAQEAYERARERLHVSTAAERVGQEIRGLVAESDALDPLERLTTCRAVAHIAGEWIDVLVQEAREAGHTWDAIGDALGVTRQAAWQSYARAAAVPTDEPGTP